MRAMYPSFYQLKEWLKMATPLGRFVNMNRLHFDQYEDSDDVEEGGAALLPVDPKAVEQGVEEPDPSLPATRGELVGERH